MNWNHCAAIAHDITAHGLDAWVEGGGAAGPWVAVRINADLVAWFGDGEDCWYATLYNVDGMAETDVDLTAYGTADADPETAGGTTIIANAIITCCTMARAHLGSQA